MKKAIELSLKESRRHLAARKLDEEESLAASTLTNTIMDSAPVYNAGPMPQGVAASRPSSAAVDEFSPQRPTYDDISSQVKITHLHYSQFSIQV